MKVAYVNVSADGVFSVTAADGSNIDIGQSPVTVSDPGLVAYLDQCPFVKRAKRGDD